MILNLIMMFLSYLYFIYIVAAATLYVCLNNISIEFDNIPSVLCYVMLRFTNDRWLLKQDSNSLVLRAVRFYQDGKGCYSAPYLLPYLIMLRYWLNSMNGFFQQQIVTVMGVLLLKRVEDYKQRWLYSYRYFQKRGNNLHRRLRRHLSSYIVIVQRKELQSTVVVYRRHRKNHYCP